MSTDTVQLAWLTLSWVGYGAIHSISASLRFKTWIATRVPSIVPAYRLLYNGVATVMLVPPLWLLYTYPGPQLWHFPTPVRWLADGVALLAVATFFHSLKFYDTGEFIGVKQWRTGACGVEDRAPMTLSWLHRYVRHPWYFLGLLVLWTREADAALLLSNLLITLYLVVGSRLEENKLVALYGDRYRRYRTKVPGLLPLPWRYLSRTEARELTGDAFN